MIRYGIHILVLTIVLAAMFFVSCTQERQPCLTSKTAVLKMKTVRAVASSTALDTPMPAAILVPLTNTPLKGTLYAKSSIFTLSLSPQADSTFWFFAADSAAGSPFDTLLFRYNRQLQFVSNACGYTYYFGLKGVQSTHHIIDSVSITNASVTNNANVTHLQVYIHPHP